MSNQIFRGQSAATILEKALRPGTIEYLKNPKQTQVEMQKTATGRKKLLQMMRRRVLLGMKNQTRSGQKINDLCVTKSNPTKVKSCKLVAAARARQASGKLNRFKAVDAKAARQCKKNSTRKCTDSEKKAFSINARIALGKSVPKTKKANKANTPKNASVRRSSRLGAKKR